MAGFATSAIPGRDADAGPDTAELVGLYVYPAHWRGGLGRALLQEAMARSRAHGCREMTVWMLEGNADRDRFYGSFGFERRGAPASATAKPRAAIGCVRTRPPEPQSAVGAAGAPAMERWRGRGLAEPNPA